MGFTEVLTLIFVVMKCLGVISWSWWLVFLPEIIAGVIYVILSVLWFVSIVSIRRKFK